jgi:hypothetical protein
MNVFVLPGDFFYYFLALLKSYRSEEIVNCNFKPVSNSARLDIEGKMDVVVL